MTDEVTMPVSAIEMQEYLYAESLTGVAQNGDKIQLNREIRTCFRFQRFAVMTWLLQNGVSIPANLLTDQAHPPVGLQYPDRSK